MKLLASTAAIGAAALAAGCAPTPPVQTVTAASGAGQCFAVRSINGFTAVDRDTVDVQVGVNDGYRLRLCAPRGDINSTDSFGLRPTGGRAFICDRFAVEVLTPSLTGPMTCQVSSVTRLTPPPT